MRRVNAVGWPFAAPSRGLSWPGRRRRVEIREPTDRWGADGEGYEGAAALEDVARGLPPGEAAARLAVVRLALAAAAGHHLALLEGERAAVRVYVEQGGCPSEEAAALEAAVAAAVPGPTPALATALCAAAAAALASGCRGGAESLWRAAYAVSGGRRWHAPAALAAEALSALARAAGSRRGAALWRQRAQRHRRRLGKTAQ